MSAIVFERVLEGAEATAALARGLAAVLRAGDVVTLEGDLGAGKTTFVRGLAKALGVEDGLVSSPTFVLMHQYRIAAGARSSLAGGEVVHVDAYRVGDAEELGPAGYEAIVDPITRQPAGKRVVVVEWPDRISEALPTTHAAVRLKHVAQGRAAEVTLPETWRGRDRVEALITRGVTRCPVTGDWVAPTAATWPFRDDRARDADLYRWLTGGYVSGRKLEPDDLEDER